MKTIPVMIDGSTSLNAVNFNSYARELENTITDAGQTLADVTVDQHQISKSLVRASGVSQYYDDTGSASAITLTAVGHQPILAYENGLNVRFKIGYSNTGNTAVNVDGKGSKEIKTDSGSQLSSGALIAGSYIELTYTGNAATGNFVITGNSALIHRVPTFVSVGSAQLFKVTATTSNRTPANVPIVLAGTVLEGCHSIKVVMSTNHTGNGGSISVGIIDDATGDQLTVIYDNSPSHIQRIIQTDFVMPVGSVSTHATVSPNAALECDIYISGGYKYV